MHPWPLLSGLRSEQRHTGHDQARLSSGVAGWNSREDEAVTVQPLRVLRVELHELVEENVGNWCHAPVKLKCKRAVP